MATTLRRTLRPATEPPPGPAAGPVPLLAPKRQRPTWVLAGVALVLVCAAIGAWVFAANAQQTSILVAARDLGAGEVVEASDLRAVEVGRVGDVRVVQPSQQQLLVGRAARGPIPAGTILNSGLVAASDEVIPAGQVVVGVSLEPGAAPTAALAAGDRVDVLGVARSAGAPSPSSAAAQVLAAGSVWAVDAAGSGGSSVWVSLLVPAGAQAAVAQAAADDRLWLSLTGAER